MHGTQISKGRRGMYWSGHASTNATYGLYRPFLRNTSLRSYPSLGTQWSKTWKLPGLHWNHFVYIFLCLFVLYISWILLLSHCCKEGLLPVDWDGDEQHAWQTGLIKLTEICSWDIFNSAGVLSYPRCYKRFVWGVWGVLPWSPLLTLCK